MKKDQKPPEDEMRPEYRREDLGKGIRGKYLKEYRKSVTFVVDGPNETPGRVDAVRLMREIRDEISREIRGMSYEEEKRFIQEQLKSQEKLAEEKKGTV